MSTVYEVRVVGRKKYLILMLNELYAVINIIFVVALRLDDLFEILLNHVVEHRIVIAQFADKICEIRKLYLVSFCNCPPVW